MEKIYIIGIIFRENKKDYAYNGKPYCWINADKSDSLDGDVERTCLRESANKYTLLQAKRAAKKLFNNSCRTFDVFIENLLTSESKLEHFYLNKK